ncbi:MAG: universal stress protein [Pirellulaceae bacterium]|nr:universal stress protein [Pirellulaceae bacterium]
MSSFTKQPVIVPWDYSDMSKAALEKALGFAESSAQIRVIHVTPYPAVAEPSVIWGTYSEKDISQHLEKSFHKEVSVEQYPGLTFVSKFGDPGSEITHFAKEEKAGLIVISSHGRSGISRLLLGSVAERVVRLATCPVMVLRDGN